MKASEIHKLAIKATEPYGIKPRAAFIKAAKLAVKHHLDQDDWEVLKLLVEILLKSHCDMEITCRYLDTGNRIVEGALDEYLGYLGHTLRP